MSMIRRLVWTLLLAVSLAATAQPPKKVPRIGYLAAVSATADAPRLAAFRQALRELGYVEGQTIQIEYRHESADLQRLPEHVDPLRWRQRPALAVLRRDHRGHRARADQEHAHRRDVLPPHQPRSDRHA